MFSVKFDEWHNLLSIELRGNFDVQQGELLCARLEKELSKAKKGFIILTDLSKLDSFEGASYKYIQKIMMLSDSHGVLKVFQVIPNKTKDIGFNIMSIFHYSNKVKIYTYKTIEEATYYLRLATNITIKDKILTILKIVKIKTSTLSEHACFRVCIIIGGFIGLIILRQLFKAFEISLRYLYITLIALSGFWFGIKGGVMAALISMIIFGIEVNIFNSWFGREIVMKTMFVRFLIYFLSGIVLGNLSQTEKNLRKKIRIFGCAR